MTPSDQPVTMDDVLKAAAEVYAGFPLSLLPPTEDEDAAGIRSFTYSSDSGWSVRGTAVLDANSVRITSLEIQPSGDQDEVTASLVRQVPVGKIAASLRTLATLERAKRSGILAGAGARNTETVDFMLSFGPTLDDYGVSAKILPAEPPSRRGGRAPITDDLLRELAEVYLTETAEGMPPHALARVADHFDRPQETIRTWIARARKDGWLGPGMKGRAGSEPGPRLIAAQLSEGRDAKDGGA